MKNKMPSRKYESISRLGKDREMISRKDVFDLTPADSKIEIQGMKESTQKNKDKWRFIPNTGEYLMLSGIKFTGKNALGIELSGRSFEVNFCGAADRDYQAENTSGNIYNNTAGSFEVAFFDKNDMKVENGTITQLPENKAVYEYSRKADGKDAASFLVNTSGKLIYSEGTGDPVKIGIRPVSSAQAYPGDDLLLQFKIKGSEEKIQTDKKDYIAVYDKKMLWRANLYIDEGVEDWNNVHPWNAPPAGDKIAGTWADSNSKSYLANWNASDWGYNQWNRKYDLTTDFNVTDLTQLKVGDGRQVVEFSSWSPVRNQRDINNSEFNLRNNLTDRVSYDYPVKDKKINAWDSPFDFLWKLNEQKKAIKKQFTNEVQTINNDSTLTQQQKNDKLNAGGKFPRGNNNIEADKFTSSVSVKSLSEWNVTNAPDNRWRYYWKNTVAGNNSNQKAYVLGLGFFTSHSHTYNDVNNTSEKITFSEYKSAGTDCIGFVLRATSYQNGSVMEDIPNINRIYKWPAIIKGKVESNSIDIDKYTRIEKGDSKTPQPDNPEIKGRIGSYSKQFIFTSDFYDGANTGSEYTFMKTIKGKTGGPTPEQFEKVRKLVLKIIPGDIIQYDGEHIGTIAEVNYQAVEEAQTMIDLMKAVNIIECVYNSRVNYVIKRNIYMGGEFLNNDTVGETLAAAPSSSWFKYYTGEINNFTIDRLLFN